MIINIIVIIIINSAEAKRCNYFCFNAKVQIIKAVKLLKSHSICTIWDGDGVIWTENFKREPLCFKTVKKDVEEIDLLRFGNESAPIILSVKKTPRL